MSHGDGVDPVEDELIEAQKIRHNLRMDRQELQSQLDRAAILIAEQSEELASLRAEVERLTKERDSQIEYSIALQRAIETHCRGGVLQFPEAAKAHHHAELLAAHTESAECQLADARKALEAGQTARNRLILEAVELWSALAPFASWGKVLSKVGGPDDNEGILCFESREEGPLTVKHLRYALSVYEKQRAARESRIVDALNEACSYCAGTGLDPEDEMCACPKCNETGVQEKEPECAGPFVDAMDCPKCRKDVLSGKPAPRAEVKLDGCSCCGARMVSIRGRHPGDPDRLVCATCLQERMDDMVSRNDGGPKCGQPDREASHAS
jgi:hypothetical protein